MIERAAELAAVGPGSPASRRRSASLIWCGVIFGGRPVFMLRSCVEPSALGKRRDILCPMQHPDNHHGIRKRHVIDGVRIVEGHAQAWCELLTLGTAQRKEPQRLAGILDRRNDTRRNIGGGIGGDSEPDFGEVRLGGIG